MLFVTDLFDGTTVTGSTGASFHDRTPGGVSMSLAGLSLGPRTRANHSIGVRNLVAVCHIVNPERMTTFSLATSSFYRVLRVRGSVPKNQELRTITLAPWGRGPLGAERRSRISSGTSKRSLPSKCHHGATGL